MDNQRISPADIIYTLPENIKNISLNIYAIKILNLFRQIIKNKRQLQINNGCYYYHTHFQKPNAKYIGNYNKNYLKEGFGVLLWEDGIKYKGYFNTNKANGYGVFSLGNGEQYLGEFKQDQPDGFGVFTNTNEASYEGYWKGEMKSEIGIEKWPDKSIYKGEYKEGKKNGIGVYIWADGGKYIGEWKDNNLEGYGMYYFNDGRVYYGEYKENKMNGFGEFYWPEGKKYIGEYENDKKVGFGIYVWEKPKKIFLGFWKDGMQHGLGRYLDENKSKYGVWNEGKRSKWIENVEKINEYVVDDDDNKQRKYLKYFYIEFKELDMLISVFDKDNL
jgi:hypothetical protein